MTQPALFAEDEAKAPESPYRYELTRWWGRGEDDEPGYGTVSAKRILWVMLNPSTATQTEDDPTIRRCIAFSQAWGFPGLTVVNIFALRSTDPKALDKHSDPVGPSNDYVISAHRLYAPKVVAAWGANAARFPEREKAVISILQAMPEKLHVLGTTNGGHPKHPLYVAAAQELVRWVP